MDGGSTVIWGAFPSSRSRLAWRDGYPRGTLYPWAVKPNRCLTRAEVSRVREFCNQNIGKDRYFIAQDFAYIAFRTQEHLTRFRTEFGEVPTAQTPQETL